MNLVKVVLALVAIGGIAGIFWHLPPSSQVAATAPAAAPGSGRGGAARDQVVPVKLGAASIADVPVFNEGIGTVKALNTVTVRPQIDGKITEITFTEGAMVKPGDILAKLDPVTVKAQLDQATAKKALDDALLANSQRDLERDLKVGTLGVTQQVIDTQKALVAQQKAQLQSDQAAIDSAQAQLTYANVTAPIGGITGIRQVDVGNIVRNETDPIVVIAQIQPIAIVFTLPQQQLGGVTKGMAAGTLTAEALTTDGGEVLDTGKLQVIDNQVDPTTGTVKFKAEFPNQNRQLWPGQFVSIRLKVNTLKGVVVAPTVAVQQGPSGAFVYLAADDNTVSVRPVVTAQSDADNTVITSGLTAGDKIVTTGFSHLKDGAKIFAGRGGDGSGSGSGKGSGGGKSGAAPDAAAPSAGAAAPIAETAAAAAEPPAAADPTKQPGKRHHKKSGDAAGGTADAATGSGAASATQ